MAVQETITVGEAATQYLMQGGGGLDAQTEVNRFIRWLGGTRQLSKLSSHEVSGYIEHLGTSTTDITRKLDPVKAFLAYAKKEGYTASNLGVNLRPKKGSVKSSGTVRQLAERELMSEEGYHSLVEELEALKAQRPKIAEALRLAMADKDFRENAPLDAARDQQAHAEARIRELEALMKRAEVNRGEGPEALRAALGSTVVLVDESGGEMRFALVHPHEANPVQGKVSIASPTGKAVLGRAAGEQVSVTAPAGVIQYHVQAVEPGA